MGRLVCSTERDEKIDLLEDLMEPRGPKALLIGESPQGSSHLAKRLQERGCECEFAVSCEEARSSLGTKRFDLALSPMRLRGVSLFPLICSLDESNITLFYFHAVEDGCWWLPALRHGQHCFGSSALRPSEFVAVLDDVIEEIYLRVAKDKNIRQVVAPPVSSCVAIPYSSRRELSPAEPKRGKVLEQLRLEAAR